MWSTEQSDQIFSAFVEHPRLTVVVPSGIRDGLQFSDADGAIVAAALRDRADAEQVPVIVRMHAVENQPGQTHVIVYHVPDMTQPNDAGIDDWENEGGSIPDPAGVAVDALVNAAHA